MWDKVTRVCDKDSVGQGCVTKMMCNKLCDNDKKVCDKEVRTEEAERKRAGAGRYRSKNKNPTQRCGEKPSRNSVGIPKAFEFMVRDEKFELHSLNGYHGEP